MKQIILFIIVFFTSCSSLYASVTANDILKKNTKRWDITFSNPDKSNIKNTAKILQEVAMIAKEINKISRLVPRTVIEGNCNSGTGCNLDSVQCDPTYEQPLCPNGKLNPNTHMCEADPIKTICPGGYSVDKDSNVCYKDDIVCPGGGTFNPEKDRCEIKTSYECNKPIKVASSGLDFSGTKEHYIETDGVKHNTGRGWQVTVFDRSWAIEDTKVFDTHGDSKNADAMEKYINNIAINKYVVLSTWDEPKNNVYNDKDLITAMKTLGVTESLIKGLDYRSAYAFIGQKKATIGIKISEQYEPRYGKTIYINNFANGYHRIEENGNYMCVRNIDCGIGTYSKERNRCEVAPLYNCFGGNEYQYSHSLSSQTNHVCQLKDSVKMCPDEAPLNGNRGDDDRCERPIKNSECPSGYIWNKSLDHCTKNVVCPDGGTLNKSKNRCEKSITTSNSCPSGDWVKVNENNVNICVIASSKLDKYCPDNGRYSTTEHTCLKDKKDSDNFCNDSGYNPDASKNKCIKTPKCAGAVFGYDGKVKRCKDKAKHKCPDSGFAAPYIYTYDSKLQKCTMKPKCNLPLIYDTQSDRCELKVTSNMCPSGKDIMGKNYSYSFNGTKCEKVPNCPLSGQFIGGNVDKCRKQAGLIGCPRGYVSKGVLCVASNICPNNNRYQHGSSKYCNEIKNYSKFCDNKSGYTIKSNRSMCLKTYTETYKPDVVAACGNPANAINLKLQKNNNRCIYKAGVGAVKCDTVHGYHAVAFGNYTWCVRTLSSSRVSNKSAPTMNTRDNCPNFSSSRYIHMSIKGGNVDKCIVDPLPTCPSGYSLGAVDGNKNQCQKRVNNSNCPSGTTYNATTNRCEMRANSACPRGHWDSNTHTCKTYGDVIDSLHLTGNPAKLSCVDIKKIVAVSNHNFVRAGSSGDWSTHTLSNISKNHNIIYINNRPYKVTYAYHLYNNNRYASYFYATIKDTSNGRTYTYGKDYNFGKDPMHPRERCSAYGFNFCTTSEYAHTQLKYDISSSTIKVRLIDQEYRNDFCNWTGTITLANKNWRSSSNSCPRGFGVTNDGRCYTNPNCYGTAFSNVNTRKDKCYKNASFVPAPSSDWTLDPTTHKYSANIICPYAKSWEQFKYRGSSYKYPYRVAYFNWYDGCFDIVRNSSVSCDSSKGYAPSPTNHLGETYCKKTPSCPSDRYNGENWNMTNHQCQTRYTNPCTGKYTDSIINGKCLYKFSCPTAKDNLGNIVSVTPDFRNNQCKTTKIKSCSSANVYSSLKADGYCYTTGIPDSDNKPQGYADACPSGNYNYKTNKCEGPGTGELCYINGVHYGFDGNDNNGKVCYGNVACNTNSNSWTILDKTQNKCILSAKSNYCPLSGYRVDANNINICHEISEPACDGSDASRKFDATVYDGKCTENLQNKCNYASGKYIWNANSLKCEADPNCPDKGGFDKNSDRCRLDADCKNGLYLGTDNSSNKCFTEKNGTGYVPDGTNDPSGVTYDSCPNGNYNSSSNYKMCDGGNNVCKTSGLKIDFKEDKCYKAIYCGVNEPSANPNSYDGIKHFYDKNANKCRSKATVNCQGGIGYNPASGNLESCDIRNDWCHEWKYEYANSTDALVTEKCVVNTNCAGGTFNAAKNRCEYKTAETKCRYDLDYILNSNTHECTISDVSKLTSICKNSSNLTGLNTSYDKHLDAQKDFNASFVAKNISYSTLYHQCQSGYDTKSQRNIISNVCPSTNGINNTSVENYYYFTQSRINKNGYKVKNKCEIVPICLNGIFQQNNNKCYLDDLSCPIGDFACIGTYKHRWCSPWKCNSNSKCGYAMCPEGITPKKTSPWMLRTLLGDIVYTSNSSCVSAKCDIVTNKDISYCGKDSCPKGFGVYEKNNKCYKKVCPDGSFLGQDNKCYIEKNNN